MSRGRQSVRNADTNRPRKEDTGATPSRQIATALMPPNRYTKPLISLVVTKKSRITKKIIVYRKISGQPDSSIKSVVDRIFSPNPCAYSDKELLKEEFEAINK